MCWTVNPCSNFLPYGDMQWHYAFSLVFNTAPLLSHGMMLVPLTGMLIILNSYLYPIMRSVAIHEATNLAPYVEDSTVFCLLEYHLPGVFLMNKSIPVTDLLWLGREHGLYPHMPLLIPLSLSGLANLWGISLLLLGNIAHPSSLQQSLYLLPSSTIIQYFRYAFRYPKILSMLRTLPLFELQSWCQS